MPAEACAEPGASARPVSADELARSFPVRDYDLAATLTSGQAFRWEYDGAAWTGVIGPRWVRLRVQPDSIHAQTCAPVPDWTWLTEYLQLKLDLQSVLRSFPADQPMKAAVSACHGLRLLRQNPWECLASFILSSTKQIVQIRQIVSGLCRRFGAPLPTPPGCAPTWSFPSPSRLAASTEAELRTCKMGFRAPYLLEAARRIHAGTPDLEAIRHLPLADARSVLLDLPGVGRKIADCVLLFAYGFQNAFPVDVWVMKALRELYFPNCRPTPAQLRAFVETHFGPQSGYAQQYLFHYMRTRTNSSAPP